MRLDAGRGAKLHSAAPAAGEWHLRWALRAAGCDLGCGRRLCQPPHPPLRWRSGQPTTCHLPGLLGVPAAPRLHCQRGKERLCRRLGASLSVWGCSRRIPPLGWVISSGTDFPYLVGFGPTNDQDNESGVSVRLPWKGELSWVMPPLTALIALSLEGCDIKTK